MKVDEQPVVLILNGDANMREGLASLFETSSMRVLLFGSAAELSKATVPDAPCCLVLDLQLPDATGLEIQEKLAANGGPPIVFIAANGDIPSSVQAIKNGAIEFLPKPFTAQELLHAVRMGIERDRASKRKAAELTELQRAYAQLTLREQQALPLIVSGFTNKQSAAKLGIAEITLQIHRRNILKKMGARSIPDLVRMVTKLGLALSA